MIVRNNGSHTAVTGHQVTNAPETGTLPITAASFKKGQRYASSSILSPHLTPYTLIHAMPGPTVEQLESFVGKEYAVEAVSSYFTPS